MEQSTILKIQFFYRTIYRNSLLTFLAENTLARVREWRVLVLVYKCAVLFPAYFYFQHSIRPVQLY